MKKAELKKMEKDKEVLNGLNTIFSYQGFVDLNF